MIVIFLVERWFFFLFMMNGRCRGALAAVVFELVRFSLPNEQIFCKDESNIYHECTYFHNKWSCKKNKIIKSIVGILESGLLQRCEVKEREKKDGVLHEREKTNCHGKLYILFLLFYL